jgi:hypothetical protein
MGARLHICSPEEIAAALTKGRMLCPARLPAASGVLQHGWSLIGKPEGTDDGHAMNNFIVMSGTRPGRWASPQGLPRLSPGKGVWRFWTSAPLGTSDPRVRAPALRKIPGVPTRPLV